MLAYVVRVGFPWRLRLSCNVCQHTLTPKLVPQSQGVTVTEIWPVAAKSVVVVWTAEAKIVVTVAEVLINEAEVVAVVRRLFLGGATVGSILIRHQKKSFLNLGPSMLV